MATKKRQKLFQQDHYWQGCELSRATKSGAGMTKKGVKAYRRANPGSKLKTAVTGKVKEGI